MIGIIGAMDIEVKHLKNAVLDRKTTVISGIEFVSGKLGDKEVVIAKCGVGKVFAALCAQTMILHFKPACIINTGVAGTTTYDLSVGDVAVSTAVCQHDMDTSACGDDVGLISGINVIYLPADERLATLAKEAGEAQGLKVVTGTIASGDQFVMDRDRKLHIGSFFNAIACEMEGGAIGQVCYVNQLPFVVIRAISDGIDEAATDYMTFLKSAAAYSTQMVLQLVERL